MDALSLILQTGVFYLSRNACNFVPTDFVNDDELVVTGNGYSFYLVNDLKPPYPLSNIAQEFFYINHKREVKKITHKL